MLILPLNRRRGHSKSRQFGPPPAVALTLVAAELDDSPAVTLTFVRAVDVSAMDVGSITVQDVNDETTYTGDGVPTVVGPATVRVPLIYADIYVGDGVLLSADPSNGIVAAGDRTAWAGVSAVELPFG